MRTQVRSKRKPTGGRYHKRYRRKKKYELARYPAKTGLGERIVRAIKTLGGNKKHRLLSDNTTNVADSKGKVQKVEILKVIENPANPQLVRRNILNKGAIIETKIGKARITSRPGQNGIINSILVK